MKLKLLMIGLSSFVTLLIAISLLKFNMSQNISSETNNQPKDKVIYRNDAILETFYDKVPYPKEITDITANEKIPFYCPKESSTIVFNKKSHLVSISLKDASSSPQGIRMISLLSQVNLTDFPDEISGYFKECQMTNTSGYFGYLVINEYDHGYKDHVIFFHPFENTSQLSGEYVIYSQAVCKPIVTTTGGNFYIQCYEGDFSKTSLIKVSSISQGYKVLLECARSDGKLLQDSRGHGYYDSKYTCTDGRIYE